MQVRGACQNLAMVAIGRDLAQVRSKFPALAGEIAYLENAGGSQVPTCVADAVRAYMTTSYVQLGAGYRISRTSTEIEAAAHEFVNRFMHGEGIGSVVLGPSTTQLVTMLAECYSRKLKPGDEVVICQTAHEANAGPWAKLERFGVVVRTWTLDPAACFDASRPCCPIENLVPLLNDRTRLVAFPHVSNLLGEIVDVRAITKLVHGVGARVVVDGVAYAPHRAIDVRAWDVDFYGYSTYKVFGPHMAALFGKQDAWNELEGPNHFFLPQNSYKFELGGTNHEGCAGLLALQEYLAFLAGVSPARDGRVFLARDDIERAWDAAMALELPLQERLCAYLRTHPRVRIVGPASGGRERVCTVSFVHETLSSPEIVAHTDAEGIGIRYGHMYAYRLCEALGIDLEGGVVRVSMAHYNSPEEIERLIAVLDRVL